MSKGIELREANQEQPQEESHFTVVFTEPGSALFTFHPVNVTPMQLLALAGWLEVMAKDAIVQQNRQVEQMSKVSVASGPLPKDLET